MLTGWLAIGKLYLENKPQEKIALSDFDQFRKITESVIAKLTESFPIPLDINVNEDLDFPFEFDQETWNAELSYMAHEKHPEEIKGSAKPIEKYCSTIDWLINAGWIYSTESNPKGKPFVFKSLVLSERTIKAQGLIPDCLLTYPERMAVLDDDMAEADHLFRMQEIEEKLAAKRSIKKQK